MFNMACVLLIVEWSYRLIFYDREVKHEKNRIDCFVCFICHDPDGWKCSGSLARLLQRVGAPDILGCSAHCLCSAIVSVGVLSTAAARRCSTGTGVCPPTG